MSISMGQGMMYVYWLITVLSLFIALCWLKPGKREAALYAKFVLPYGALLLLFYLFKESGPLAYELLNLFSYFAYILIFLLGFYVMKCSWKRALLAAGVYLLVRYVFFILAGFFVCYDTQQLLFSTASNLLSVLFTGLLVWLCARKFGVTAKNAIVLAGTIEAVTFCVCGILWGLAHCGYILVFADDLAAGYAPYFYYRILFSSLYVVSFALCMRYVQGIAQKRAWAFASVLLIGPILHTILHMRML